MSRKFREPAAFASSGEYHLLPFRFHPINDHREVLVSEVGDYILCPRGTATRIVDHELLPSDPLYADLLANFFISETAVPALLDVLATRYRTKKSFLDSFTALHIFVVTLRCNHSCPYCQVSRQTADKSKYDMSPAHLNLALDLTFQSPSPDLTIEFQGGEPLLAFDLIRQIVERSERLARSANKNLTFVACTNLTTVDDEILQFCKQHAILISTSLDGPQFVHDRNRPMTGASSYEEVIKALSRTRAILGPDRVSALMTTSRFSLDHPEAIVDAYVENGFDHIFLRHVSPFGFATRYAHLNKYSVAEYMAFYKRALRHILHLNCEGIELVEDYACMSPSVINARTPSNECGCDAVFRSA